MNARRHSVSLLLLPLLTLVIGVASARADDAPVKLELIEVTKIWDKAPHNAFTDLIRFRDQWYIAFREAKSHYADGDGDVRVIRSADGKEWESVALLDWGPEWDMRDAKLNVLPDGRLMLNTAAVPLNNIGSRQSLVYFTKDGTDWSDGPHKVGEPDYWLWSVVVHPDGAVYGVGYGDLKNRPVTARLYRSDDGINYETIVPTMSATPTSSETALLFRNDGSAVALVRLEGARSRIGTARGDYTQWTFKDIDQATGGPELIELPDGTLVVGTRLRSGKVRTSLCWVDPEAGRMAELLRLPSRGDSSYPGLAWHDGVLWMSYYSTHEGKTSIYLAKVRVEPAAK
ncbi:MAG: exo-alpha-sialidase [Pirellulaceae bacterium]|nr:exo-alpha-sialidase [Pirellulaceae bacterium]